MDEGQTQTPKQRNWKRIALYITGVIVALTLVAGLIFVLFIRETSPIPKSISSQAVFNLYYPTKLPPGYKIDNRSFMYQDRRVSYNLVGAPKQPKILVTIQPKPATYNLDEFANNLPGKIGVLTPYGTAAVGISGATRIGSLEDGDIWLLMTSPSNVTDQSFKTILTSLKKQ